MKSNKINTLAKKLLNQFKVAGIIHYENKPYFIMSFRAAIQLSKRLKNETS